MIKNWNKNLNKTLIDSFKIALKRDQEERPTNLKLVKKNIEKYLKNLNLKKMIDLMNLKILSYYLIITTKTLVERKAY